MPFYLERGFTTPNVWPWVTTNPPGLLPITYANNGNAFWHDPGELLYAMALAFPYLDAALQAEVKTYMAAEMQRYPPLSDLPWIGLPWLKQGVARERYTVPFRASLNNWPPPGAYLSALYGLWLWSKNTGDWTYATSLWSRANLWSARKSAMTTTPTSPGRSAMRAWPRTSATPPPKARARGRSPAMDAGRAFDTFRHRAEQQYPRSPSQATGWSVPVFYGLTPEVGLYLREQIAGRRPSPTCVRETGRRPAVVVPDARGGPRGDRRDVVRGASAAWSHFLAHA